MAELVYSLCAATSILCFVLLLRSYLRTKLRLLLWSSAAFLAFAATNVLLFVDLVLMPGLDLSLLRTAVTVLGVALLLYGLITES
jgi:Family of unknown function (DUF5985)